MEKHVLLVLTLAHKFGLRELTSITMDALITCDAAWWKEAIDIPMDGRLLLYCRQIHDKRIEVYSEMVEKLTEHELSNTKNIKDSTRETCMSCTVTRAQWTHK